MVAGTGFACVQVPQRTLRTHIQKEANDKKGSYLATTVSVAPGATIIVIIRWLESSFLSLGAHVRFSFTSLFFMCGTSHVYGQAFALLCMHSIQTMVPLHPSLTLLAPNFWYD